MIPLVQISADAKVIERYGADLDLVIDTTSEDALRDVQTKVAETASGRYAPRLYTRGVTEFQLTRGLLGLSINQRLKMPLDKSLMHPPQLPHAGY